MAKQRQNILRNNSDASMISDRYNKDEKIVRLLIASPSFN